MELRNLRFAYRRNSPVFDGVSFAFPEGKTLLLGRNGAGKTTLMKLLIGALRPQRGTVRISTEISGRQMQRKVGFMPQNLVPTPGLSVGEQVAYYGWLRGLSWEAARPAAVEVLRMVGLSELEDKSAQQVSGGQLRRLGLACALVHRPALAVLDEPTAGLDPEQRRHFRGLLRGLPETTNLLVSTHQLDDVVGIYSNVVVLDAGRFVWSGTLTEFRRLDDTGSDDVERAFLHLVGRGI